MEIQRTCDLNQKGFPSLFPLAMSGFFTEAILTGCLDSQTEKGGFRRVWSNAEKSWEEVGEKSGELGSKT
jgi:hypothetical protein